MSEPKFQLRAILTHKEPIRTIAEAADGRILTLGFGGASSLWTQNKNSFIQSIPFTNKIHGPKSLVLSLKALRNFSLNDQNSAKSPIFASCGSDKMCHIWNLKGEILQSLLGHNNTVNSVEESNDGTIITGSFDTTAKIWKNGVCISTLGGDHKYGVESCFLNDGKIVTASFSDINIWNDNKIIKKISNAHSHAIRRLIPLPNGFASCSNDGFVKVWDFNGENVLSIKAHEPCGQKPSYVYSIVYLLLTNEILSIGEDGNCYVWNQFGKKKETIIHPQYIREIILLKNGDFATTNGNYVYIFTRDETRFANEHVQNEFKCHFIKKNEKNEQIKYSDESIILSPGEKDGTTVVIKRKNLDYVYSFDGSTQKWVEIGTCVNDDVSNGSNYDQTIQIEKEDGTQIPFNFNYSDDPEKITNDFCKKNNLSEIHLAQIIEYIQTLKSAKETTENTNTIKETNQNYYSKFETFPISEKSTFEVVSNCNEKAMRQKLFEFGQKLDEKTIVLDEFIGLIEKRQTFHITSMPQSFPNNLQKLLKWPKESLFPVLDGLRILLCHGEVSKSFENDGLKELLEERIFEEGQNQLNCVLFCRVLGNFIAMRLQNDFEIDSERKAVVYVTKCLERLSPNNPNLKFTPNQKYYSSYISAIFNFVIWTGKSNPNLFEKCFKNLFDDLICAFSKITTGKTLFCAAASAASLLVKFKGIWGENKEKLIVAFKESLKGVKDVELKRFDTLLKDLDNI